MSTNKKRIFFVILLLSLVSGVYIIQNKKSQMVLRTVDSNDVYVNFELEVYDKISTIYWNKLSPEDLSNLFKLSINKATASSTSLYSKDRDGVERMLRTAFSYASTTELKKKLALDTAQIALFNIPPAGRNQLFSQKQETDFRNSVANVNPAKNLYTDLGLNDGANSTEVTTAYKDISTKLKNATTTADKESLEKAKYSYSVLSVPDSKLLYDQAKIEPTLKYRKIGSTFYADLSQIAPSTLFELVRAVDNASTTNMSSLVIDFRGNIGGALDFLPAFFGLFVGKDQFVFDLYRQGERKTERTTQPKYPVFDKFKEIAILTDNMTQSTAELTASTFKKFNMAKVVGKTTRGWGTVENTYPMESTVDPSEKYILLLVNSITLREDGEPIEGRGVDPDIDTSKAGWQTELSSQFQSTSLINAVKQVLK